MIDLSSSFTEKQFAAQRINNGGYSTATITKRKNNISPFVLSDQIQRIDNHINDIDMIFEVGRNAVNNDENMQPSIETEQPQHYEDITDVLVTAKMQEECKFIKIATWGNKKFMFFGSILSFNFSESKCRKLRYQYALQLFNLVILNDSLRFISFLSLF